MEPASAASALSGNSTPPPPPPPSSSPLSPPSPGGQSRLVTAKSEEVGDSFATELFAAVVNDCYMRVDCWCGSPTVYASKAEAEIGVGHLRFFRAGEDLRVIQVKDDERWLCACGSTGEYHPAYAAILEGSSRKRPAEDSEFELIANSEEKKSGRAEREVLATAGTSVPGFVAGPAGQEHEGSIEQVFGTARSMLAGVAGFVKTMGGSVLGLLDKIRGVVRPAPATEVRAVSGANVTIKRIKRMHSVPANPGLATDQLGIAEFPYLEWVTDVTQNVGLEALQRLYGGLETLQNQLDSGKYSGGVSVETIKKEHDPASGELLELNSALAHLSEQLYGKIENTDSRRDRANKFNQTVIVFRKGLRTAMGFMDKVYNSQSLDNMKRRHPTPPKSVCLADVFGRCDYRIGAEFLGFLLTIKDVIGLTGDDELAITKIVVDVNALHKQELLPSFVICPGLHDIPVMPGSYPTPFFDEIEVGQTTIDPVYALKHPSPAPRRVGTPLKSCKPRRIIQPKGILKQSKPWDENPASPKYVSTPEKKRTLDFLSPLALYSPPSKVPVVAITAAEAEEIAQQEKKAAEAAAEAAAKQKQEDARLAEDLYWQSLRGSDKHSPSTVAMAESEMRLRYHHLKYGKFLQDVALDIKHGIEKQKKLDEHKMKIEQDRLDAELQHHQQLKVMSKTRASPYNLLSEEERRVLWDKHLERLDSQPHGSTVESHEIAVSRQIDLEVTNQIEGEWVESIERRNAEEAEHKAKEEARRKAEEEARLAEEEARRVEDETRRRVAEEAAAYEAETGLRRARRALVTPLQPDWDAKVDRAASRDSFSANLAQAVDGSNLTGRDMSMLIPPTEWLNDNVINASLAHLAKRINAVNDNAGDGRDQAPKCAALSSFFYPRINSAGPNSAGRVMRQANIRAPFFLDIDTILVPICNGSHWTLGVVRPTRRTVTHMDSMRADGSTEVTGVLLNWVKATLGQAFVESDWKVVDYAAPRQTNGWDCGVFTITNAICIAAGLDPRHAYTSRELPLQRRRLAAVLLNQGFHGDFSLDDL
ncbi:hypothetical protein B0T24DRAFT_531935 [Lasiosphaeria ovina]|uniref:Ubiquitin-like protease family profile domain-containing protein n=1 Tax=Lasiosphaeria ovina TaxID=92902 RepID=A0AAE0K8D8_9PEZI|nr:hypothetical protein B0T24DRAFT_531935 [Lasiosphaeria ovina]